MALYLRIFFQSCYYDAGLGRGSYYTAVYCIAFFEKRAVIKFLALAKVITQYIAIYYCYWYIILLEKLCT